MQWAPQWYLLRLYPLVLMKSLLPSIKSCHNSITVGEFVSSVNSGKKDHQECHEWRLYFEQTATNRVKSQTTKDLQCKPKWAETMDKSWMKKMSIVVLSQPMVTLLGRKSNNEIAAWNVISSSPASFHWSSLVYCCPVVFLKGIIYK